MKAAGYFVAIVIELSAGMENGHDHFGSGTVFLRMYIHGYAAAIIGHSDRAIGVEDHFDLGAMPSEGLVNRVIDDLEDHVVETGSVVRVSNIHPRPLTNGVEAS
jgi:hypothetical protein